MFREWMGEPLHQYAIRRRMERARTLLREGEMLVKQVARRVGYDDPLYFSRAFHDYFGEWPTEVGSDIVF
ncbi:MAG: helix-turn-helix transcriptional regulator [Planctomycetota bacterium]